MQPKNSIRRKPAFPDGMLIVLGVIILCVIVTWFIPSGQYDRILDASGRQIVDPNSFHYIESEKISLLRIPHFIVEGTIAQAEMIFFLLTIGGCYEIVMHTGVLQAIIARMAKWKVRDMAFILVFTLVFAVIAAPAGGVVSFIACGRLSGAARRCCGCCCWTDHSLYHRRCPGNCRTAAVFRPVLPDNLHACFVDCYSPLYCSVC